MTYVKLKVKILDRIEIFFDKSLFYLIHVLYKGDWILIISLILIRFFVLFGSIHRKIWFDSFTRLISDRIV